MADIPLDNNSETQVKLDSIKVDELENSKVNSEESSTV